MLFYTVDLRKKAHDADKEESYCKKFRAASENILSKNDSKIFMAVSRMGDFTAKIVVALKACEARTSNMEELVGEFNALTDFDFQVKNFSEITAKSFKRELKAADMSGYIDDNYEIERLYDIDDSRPCYTEGVVSQMSRERIEQDARELLYDKSFLPEIERIYAMKNPDGDTRHPVHYVIKGDDFADMSSIKAGLISALYQNGRLQSSRYSEINFHGHVSASEVTACYTQQGGGCVVVRLSEEKDSEEYSDSDSNDAIISRILRNMKEQEEDVLTIFMLPVNCEGCMENLRSSNEFAFVELDPENAVGEAAERYLKYKAEKANAPVDEKLFKNLRCDRAMCRWELREAFNEWYTNYMIETKYPLYADIKQKNVKKTNESFGSASRELEDMIGLEEVKRVIGNAVDYYKMQKLYKAFGKHVHRPSMHMLFTGNPGSAKTTVARLFANILKENDVITSGTLVEVGRADLVGRYVGHTAPKVREAFAKAKGGVLFIDEAYSLVEERDGLYGDEAINTIVQEMENNQRDTIVIFAGYPDKMEGFLDKNPGLRSRIAFHVHFEDYSPEELMDIARLMAKKRENKFAPGCEDALRKIFTRACTEEEFGNGRYVRNVLEKAEMSRASRLAAIDPKELTERDFDLFFPEDFTEDKRLQKGKKKGNIIGFAS